MKRAILALMLAGPGQAGAAPLVQLPFVGCPNDGQVGPHPAPRHGTHIPRLPVGDATNLAYYQTGDPIDGAGVIGPRGWHCTATYGSNGSTIYLTPKTVSFSRLFAGAGFDGPAIQYSKSSGETSGRFEVAAIAPRYFPATISFARELAKEFPDTRVETMPFPNDILIRKGPHRVDYETPAGKEGLGTRTRLKAGNLPILGFISVDETPDLSHLAVRLPAGLQSLARVIVEHNAQPPN